MVDFAREASEVGVKKFIAMSSNSPCGYSKDNKTLFDEDSPYRPYMGYGKSKMLMELGIKKLVKDRELETNFSIIRSPWFYGPYQPARQTDFFRMIKNGVFPLIGKGKSLRSMAYTENLCQGILCSSNYFDSNGEIFWIADAKPYSMEEIVMTVKTLLSDHFNLKVADRQIFLPSLTADFARGIDKITQSLGFYLQKFHVLSEMNQTIACNIDKAKNILGYEPKIHLKEGMQRSIEWCLNNGREI